MVLFQILACRERGGVRQEAPPEEVGAAMGRWDGGWGAEVPKNEDNYFDFSNPHWSLSELGFEPGSWSGAIQGGQAESGLPTHLVLCTMGHKSYP